MLLEMFANELSLVPAAMNTSAGQERASQFVLTMRAATQKGVRRTLHIPEYFLTCPIAPDYNWYAWLSDRRVDIELRRYFRSLSTQTPFLRDEPDVEAAWAEIDCEWNRQKALGLKAAYAADGLALSILSGQEWDNPSIECEIQEIIENDVSCRNEFIHHASRIGHLDPQTDWIRRRIQAVVSDGRELWRNVGNFFPSLICCPGVEEQMTSLPSHSLASIMRGLFHLNDFCLGWQSGPFDPSRISCVVSPDSQSTLELYRPKREFLCPDGQKRLFSWHAKVGRWRIYFDPAPGPGQLFIGYVGTHLRTAKYS